MREIATSGYPFPTVLWLVILVAVVGVVMRHYEPQVLLPLSQSAHDVRWWVHLMAERYPTPPELDGHTRIHHATIVEHEEQSRRRAYVCAKFVRETSGKILQALWLLSQASAAVNVGGIMCMSRIVSWMYHTVVPTKNQSSVPQPTMVKPYCNHHPNRSLKPR